jgi:hypothetical protein
MMNIVTLKLLHQAATPVPRHITIFGIRAFHAR